MLLALLGRCDPERHLEQHTDPDGATGGNGYNSVASTAVGPAVISIEHHAPMSLKIVQIVN